MNKNILYIHGAMASSVSFNYLHPKLPEHVAHYIEYDIEEGIRVVIDRTKSFISEIGEPVSIIAHSMGGLIAVTAAIENGGCYIDKILTFSAPFGGLEGANMMRWINRHPFYQDMNTSAPVVNFLKNNVPTMPVRTVVTTRGSNPIYNEPNDGVVTVASQMAIKHFEQIFVEHGHCEVLLSCNAVVLAQQFLF